MHKVVMNCSCSLSTFGNWKRYLWWHFWQTEFLNIKLGIQNNVLFMEQTKTVSLKEKWYISILLVYM